MATLSRFDASLLFPVDDLIEAAGAETSAAAAREVTRLQALADQQTAEIADLRRQLADYTQLTRWRDGQLAEHLADQFGVSFPEYQGDASGRVAVCPDQDSFQVDLSDVDDLIPVQVRVAKQDPNGGSVAMVCRLRLTKLVYDIHCEV